MVVIMPNLILVGPVLHVKLDNTIEFAIRWVKKGQIASLNLKRVMKATFPPFNPLRVNSYEGRNLSFIIVFTVMISP